MLTVVVDPELAESFKFGRHIAPADLVRNSVQIWSNRVRELGIPAIQGHEELYRWHLGYDPDLLGYMAGVLPVIYAARDSIYFI